MFAAMFCVQRPIHIPHVNARRRTSTRVRHTPNKVYLYVRYVNEPLYIKHCCKHYIMRHDAACCVENAICNGR